MWIGKRTSRATCYHTNKECPRLRAEPTKASEATIEWHDLGECDWCKENAPNGGPKGPNRPQEYVGLSEGEWP